MKAVILYQPNSESETSVQDYVREFGRETGKAIALVDSNSVQGVEIAKLYDVLQFPSVVVFGDDGTFIQSWLERDKWPTSSELSYYNQ